MAIGILLTAWTASRPAKAMSLGVRMALWGAAPAQRQTSGGSPLADAVEAQGLTFETGGDAAWFVQSEVVHGGGTALRSGAIGDDEESWVETTVMDAGTVSFWWKASSEVYKKTPIDFVSFSIDGGEMARLGGETAWTNMTFVVSGSGRHVLRWTYSKDMMDTSGEDCAWLDCVTWTSDDPLPALDVAATDGDVAAIIAGLSDVRLSEKVIGTTAYGAFRAWVDGKGLSHTVVRTAPNAWLSYALDAPGLMSKEITSDDVHIVSLDVEDGGALGTTRPTSFTLEVAIDGVNIGEGARLAEVLSVEGATELDESAFSTDGLSFTLQRTADGKAKAIVTPVGSPPSFFLRMSVK